MNIESENASNAYAERLEHAKHGFEFRQRFLNHDEALFEVVQAFVLEFIRCDPTVSHRDSPLCKLQFQSQCPGQSQKQHRRMAEDHLQESKELQLWKI